MQFKVKILAAEGHCVHETHDGSSADDIRARLDAAGRIVLSVRPLRPWMLAEAPRQPRERQRVFCEQLQTLIGAGIPVAECLPALRDSERDPRFRAVLSELIADIGNGVSLSAAMARHPVYFPQLLISMLQAAERTGALTEALQRHGRLQAQTEALRANLWAAATYPLMLLGAGSCVVLFLLLYVVPRFALVYRDVHTPLPWTARLLLGWGEFADGRAGVLLLTLGLAGLGCVLLLRRAALRHRLLARLQALPRLGDMLKELQLSHYFHSLGLLLQAGIPLPRALELSRTLLSTPLQQAADAAALAVDQGQRLSSSLERNGLITPVALRLIQAGERSGQLATMLSQAADFHDRRIRQATELLTRILGPVLMIVMGLLIGGIVVLLYLPIFQLAEGLG